MTSSQRLRFTVLRADQGWCKFRIGNMAPAMDQAQPVPGIQPYHFELLPYHFELLPCHFELLPCRVERSVVIDVHLQFFDRDCVLRVRMTGEDADSDEVFSDCKQITRQVLKHKPTPFRVSCI